MNRSLSLIRYAKLDAGWRRGPVVMGKNGRIKADYMLVGKGRERKEVYCPEGRYQMLRYEGSKAVYTDLGTDAAEVLIKFRSEEGKHEARVKAAEAGLTIPNDDRRKTLRQCAQSFLEMHRNLPHRSNDSVAVYTYITETFLSVFGGTYPEQITEEDVIRWHGWMRNEKGGGLGDRTAANRYKSFRGWLKYCQLDPAKIISRSTHKLLRTYTKKEPNYYEQEVVDKLIAASTDENRALLWEFAYKVGCRDSELQHVTRYDLHGLDGKYPVVHIKERDEYGNIKDAEERIIELPLSLAAKLKKWLKDNPKKVLVFGTIHDKPDTKMLLALKVTARRAGLNCGHCKGCKSERNECREFTLHRFRRTYTSKMLTATHGDLPSVMKRTGHSDLASVMRYLAPRQNIRDAVNAAFD